AALLLISSPQCSAIHHMKLRMPDSVERANVKPVTPLIVTNYCSDTVWPAINTQSGTGPSETGFELSAGDSYNQTVSENWQGRVWGRTNCSFTDSGGPTNGPRACGSGDCNGQLSCWVSGDNPVTLAEFTLDAGDGHTYYDISLVDGYNLPLAIVMQPLGNASIDDIPPNLTNPSCMATAGWLADEEFYPYDNNNWYLGTNGSYPLPFETNVTNNDVMEWCPWDLQVNTPSGSPDGVYTYPDTTVERPIFDPCYSACAKYYTDEYCCTGQYNSPESCQANYYANAAKSVCPDAYSFAYDDQTSTFIIPSGAGFEIVFCPGGRSTNILATEGNQLRQLASSG
ncbi:Osmotin, thaumatin-like protein, partial [Saccharata proteae CBS 121410]